MQRIFSRLLVVVAVVATMPRAASAQWHKVPGVSLRAGGNGAIVFKHGEVWAGIKDLFVSKDSGATWKQSFYPSDGENIVDIDLYDSNTIVVATQDDISLSTDGGVRWKVLRTREDFNTVAFAGSPNNIVTSQTVTQGEGVFATSDGGNNWIDYCECSYAAKVIYRPELGDVLFVDGESAAGSALLYSSTDRGFTFSTKPPKLNPDYYDIAYGGCKFGNIYIADDNTSNGDGDGLSHIDVSTDNGTTFRQVFTHESGFLCGSVVVGNEAILCQTTEHGVFRSTNGGTIWAPLGGPSGAQKSRTLAAIDQDRIIAADTYGDLFVTTNGGGDSALAPRPEWETPLDLATTTLRVYQGACGASDTTLTIGIDLCDTGSAVLEGVSLVGASRFTIHAGQLPRTITSFDTIGITYFNRTTSNDTATLKLTYSILGIRHDTTVALIGVGSTAFLSFDVQSFAPQSLCGTSEGTLKFWVPECDNGEVTLTGISLNGSNDFKLVPITLPKFVGLNDSVNIDYFNLSSIPDTAYVTFSYTSLGDTHDTTIAIVGPGFGVSVAAVEDSAIYTVALDTVRIPIHLSLSNPNILPLTNINTITYSIRYDTTYLNLPDSLSQSLITPRFGYILTGVTAKSGLLTVNELDVNHDTLQTLSDLGAVGFIVRKATSAPTSVILNSFSLALFDQATPNFCLLVERSLIASIVAAIADVQLSESNVRSAHFPDPVHAGETLSLRIDQQTASPVKITIFDLLGAAIESREFGPVPSGAHTIEVPLSHCEPGTYFLRVELGASVHTEKFTIIP